MNIQQPYYGMQGNVTLTTTKTYNSKDIIQEVKYLNDLIVDNQALLSKEEKNQLKEYRSKIISQLKNC